MNRRLVLIFLKRKDMIILMRLKPKFNAHVFYLPDKIIINLENLSSGLYFLTVEGEYGQKKTIKFIEE